MSWICDCENLTAEQQDIIFELSKLWRLGGDISGTQLIVGKPLLDKSPAYEATGRSGLSVLSPDMSNSYGMNHGASTNFSSNITSFEPQDKCFHDEIKRRSSSAAGYINHHIEIMECFVESQMYPLKWVGETFHNLINVRDLVKKSITQINSIEEISGPMVKDAMGMRNDLYIAVKSQQEALNVSNLLEQRLAFYKGVEGLRQRVELREKQLFRLIASLDDQTINVNSPDFDFASSDNLNSVVSDLDNVLSKSNEAIRFFTLHLEYPQATSYMNQYEKVRSIVCVLVKTVILQILEKAESQVNAKVKQVVSDGKNWSAPLAVLDTDIHYGQFRFFGFLVKGLSNTLKFHEELCDADSLYTDTLGAIEGQYVAIRTRLMFWPVHYQFKTLLTPDCGYDSSRFRPAILFLLAVFQLEFTLFESFFPIRNEKKALRDILMMIWKCCSEALRSYVFSCDSIDELGEMAKWLEESVLKHREVVGEADIPALHSFFHSLYQDIQERLIFRIDTFVRDHIEAVKYNEFLLDYPSKLVSFLLQSSDKTPKRLFEAWIDSSVAFPAIKHTISCLETVSRSMSLPAFQIIAEAVTTRCVHSVLKASRKIKKNNQSVDADLFLIRHLLILKNHLSRYKCDFVSVEKVFDFSIVKTRLRELLSSFRFLRTKAKDVSPETNEDKSLQSSVKTICNQIEKSEAGRVASFFKFFTPESTESQQNANRLLEDVVEEACSTVIAFFSSAAILPLLRTSAIVTEASFLAQAESLDLAGKIETIVSSYGDHLQETFSRTLLYLTLYLSNPLDSSDQYKFVASKEPLVHSCAENILSSVVSSVFEEQRHTFEALKKVLSTSELECLKVLDQIDIKKILKVCNEEMESKFEEKLLTVELPH